MCMSSAMSVYVHACTVQHAFSHYKQTHGPHIHTHSRESQDHVLATAMMSEFIGEYFSCG